MAKLYIPRGLPASGKSTAIREAVKFSSAPAVCVGRDYLRDQLFGTRLGLSQAQESLVSIAEKAQVRDFLKAGVDVYVDAMHLKNKYVRDWAKFAANLGADIRIWDSFLRVPLEECIWRDSMREGEARLGGDVIRSIHKRFFPIPPLKLDDLEPLKVRPYVPDPNKPLAYMVDIDGTCTMGPCDRSPYDWAKVGQDKPNEFVISTIWALYNRGYHIIFCSGRDAVCRPQTMDWLSMIFGPIMMSKSSLFMRAEGDMRKDSVVKMELFDEHIRDNFHVVAVFDDRNQVVDMWRSLGLPVFQVGEGDF